MRPLGVVTAAALNVGNFLLRGHLPFVSRATLGTLVQMDGDLLSERGL